MFAARLGPDFKGLRNELSTCFQRRGGYRDMVNVTVKQLGTYLSSLLAWPMASAASMALRTFPGVITPAS